MSPEPHAASLHLIDVLGAWPSIETICVRAGSALPTVSYARNRTVVVAAIAIGPLYRALPAFGVVPSSVYRTAATPEPCASSALNVSETGPAAQASQLRSPHVAVVVGASVSTRTTASWTGSALPAWS